ncbi:hypothetical protein M3210_14580 [Oceanobacillus luteolus]|uniref:hypothetical protein n=1 Tax=Oceanobacillus luteolus TaxID=1274358 RepID=UPI00203C6092|nr:hypothetical protein [Oceanobacillus luteolus]MCM3741497.1 hypothetical protein [Oceanobacillus luteolus]
MKQRISKWILTFGAIGALIGMTLGQLITGTLNLSGLLGSLSGVLLFFIIDLIRNRMKKDNTPDIDERTRYNMIRYYVYASNIFIGVAFLLLAIVTFVGMEQVSVYYLWIMIFVYFIISGIGAVVVSRK